MLFLLAYITIFLLGFFWANKKTINNNSIKLFSIVVMIAHLLIFVVSPAIIEGVGDIFYNQKYALISILSLLALIFANLLPVVNFTRKKLILNERLITKLSLGVVIYIAYKISIGLISAGSNKVVESLNALLERSLISYVEPLVVFIIPFLISYHFKKNKYVAIVLFILYIAAVVLNSAHRTPVAVAMISFVGMIFFINGAAVNLKTLIIGCISFTSMALAMYIMNFFRQGLDIEGGTLGSVIISLLSGLSTSLYMMELIEDNQYPIEWGQYLHYYVLGMIPRILWDEKPVTSFNVRITETLHNYKVGETPDAIIYTFTAPGEGYIQFGYLGVLVFTIIAVMLYKQLLSFVSSIEYSEYFTTSIIMSWFINFRGAFDSIFFYVLEQFLYLLVLLILGFLKIKSPNCTSLKV